ncbi:MAG: type 4a pilus biogenesis protein PilO [Acinetobacter sp.]
MSRDQIPQRVTGRVVRQKFSFDAFIQQFNSLDTRQYGGWPISVKITCWVLLFAFVCFLGYFILIRSKIDAIHTAHSQEKVLLSDYRIKESKLRNLQQYQSQFKEIESKFSQLLEQLPKESEIPGLVEDINKAGVSAGLKIKNIALDKEVKQEIFIEQPISMDAVGDYHAFGRFSSAIAALPRIVTLHDFTITANTIDRQKSDIPVISYSLKAKTYRYLSDGDKAASDVAKGNQ